MAKYSRQTRQRTFKANGEKITIKSVQRTHCGNLCGFSVWVNGRKYFINHFKRDDAEDRAFKRWLDDKSGDTRWAKAPTFRFKVAFAGNVLFIESTTAEKACFETMKQYFPTNAVGINPTKNAGRYTVQIDDNEPFFATSIEWKE